MLGGPAIGLIVIAVVVGIALGLFREPLRWPLPSTVRSFFDRIRASGVFGPTLSQTEVDGLNGLLEAWGEQGWPSDLRWVAYKIATASHQARLNGAIGAPPSQDVTASKVGKECSTSLNGRGR